MEKFSIYYKGGNYSALSIALDKISDIDSGEDVIIADCALWDAIERDYNDGVSDAVMLDDSIYYYCDHGMIDNEFMDELDVIRYFEGV